MLRPITRLEQYLAKIAGAADTAPAPLTRLEQFLAKIAGITGDTPQPITRLEQYLSMIAESGGSGSGYDGAPFRTVTPETDGAGFTIANVPNLHVGVVIADYPFWETGTRRYLLGGVFVVNSDGDVINQSRIIVLEANGSINYYAANSASQNWTYTNGTFTITGGSTWYVRAGVKLNFYYR